MVMAKGSVRHMSTNRKIEGNTPQFYMWAYRFRNAKRHLANHSRAVNKTSDRKGGE